MITQAVIGLGGIGKSELTLQYAHRHRGAYRPVWWITAETLQRIQAGLAELGRALCAGVASSAAAQAPAEEVGNSTNSPWMAASPRHLAARWVVERSHAWMNGFGKLRRCTEKRSRVVDFYLSLSATIVTLRMLIRRATPRYRWDGRPTARRLK